MGNNARTPIPAKYGLILALLAGLAALFSGLGSRYELWNFRTGLLILRGAAFAGIAALLFSLTGLVSVLSAGIKRGFIFALLGLLLAAVTVALPWHWLQVAKKVPPIHDITTDTLNPPRFSALLPLRRKAANTSDYGGPHIAEKQRKAYPDIVPLVLIVPGDAAFDKALAVAREMGWQIIDANKDEGRIEAVDTTFWFGFKDDIVIRISKTASGSRIDIRSVSRVGVSDIGTNAKRIRKFLAGMKR